MTFNVTQIINDNVPVKVKINNGTMIQAVSELIKLDIPTYDGLNQPTHPSVLRFNKKWNGYKYWMAMTPHSNGSSAVENPSIVASNDGINWIVPTGVTNPLVSAPSAGFYADTALVFANNIMYIYWAHFDSSDNGNYRISSINGITWSPPERTNGATDITNNGLTNIGGNKWIAFSHDGNTLYKITSSDGINWYRRHPVASNVGGNIWHSQVYYDGSGFHFLINSYGSQHESGADGSKLYYGYSKDGNSIAIDPSPLLIPEDNTPMSAGLYTSQLVPYEGQDFIIYVSSITTDKKWAINVLKVRLTARHSDISVPLQSPIHRVLFDNIEIRDTADYYVGGTAREVTPEMSTHKDKYILVQNSLDSDVSIRFLTVGGDMFTFQTMKYNGIEPSIYTIPKGASPAVIDKNAIPLLGTTIGSSVRISIRCTTAPTVGNITLTLTSTI